MQLSGLADAANAARAGEQQPPAQKQAERTSPAPSKAVSAEQETQ